MNTAGLLVFDGLLLISIVSLAWASLTSTDERNSVILFIAFGLVLAVAWGRLLAPDVALAEAAIGAGLSGALLLAAVRRHPVRPSPAVGANRAVKHGGSGVRVMLQWSVTMLCAGLAGTLAWALLHAFNSLPHDAVPLAISANLEASGVSNPVTAVLLNFRAYDTLLELAVLLTAVLGILALGRAIPRYRSAGPIFDGLTRWLVPVLILTAGYLLWVGAHAPGGAFQAGATLAAAGVVLHLAGRPHTGLPAGFALRLLMAAGVGMFLLVGLTLLGMGQPFLGYPPAWAGALILIIETAAMLAIAATLVLAFIGDQPQSLGGNAAGETGISPADAAPAPASRATLSGTESDSSEAGNPQRGETP
ncbi:MAG: hydrogenase subunit MbhD domain-containing protein [Gammaproteobacteria bacterium]